MSKHAARPGYYTFAQMMHRYGMPTELAKSLYAAGCKFGQ